MTIQPETDSVRPAPLSAVNTGLPAPLNSCPAELLDGWAVHDSALRHRMNTLLLPGQALMAFHGEDHTSGVAFAHGVANSTWLSAATLVQDTRVRRDVMAANGIRIPRGRSFSLTRGTPFAKQFAESIGYPVVVKPMIGESTVEVMPNIKNEDELEQAVQYLRTAPSFRPDFTTASYAFTQILTPKTNTTQSARPTYRYLVEEHLKGQYLRLLTSNGVLLSAVIAPNGPWCFDHPFSDVTYELHPDIGELAARISNALPGLAVMAADIVVGDCSAPLSENHQATVVDVSERPWMHVQHAAAPELVPEIAQRLLRDAARAENLTLHAEDPSHEITAQFRWEGLSQVEADIRSAHDAAKQLGLTLQIDFEDPVSGVISGTIAGDSSTIALLNEFLIAGDILSAQAMSVETRPS